MSSPIVVRALEAELVRVAARCRDALYDVGRLSDKAGGVERKRIEEARTILTKAANEHDAVEGELQAARSAVRLSGDLSTTDNGESAPAGRCAP